jgi:hypothetical protein
MVIGRQPADELGILKQLIRLFYALENAIDRTPHLAFLTRLPGVTSLMYLSLCFIRNFVRSI